MGSFRVERVEPVLRVENMEASLRFYEGVLGFRRAEWSNENFAGISRDGGSLYLCQGEQGRGGAWIWVGIDDVDALHQDLKTRGVDILMAPTDFDWAREMRVADPDGNVLRFGSAPR